MTELLENWPAGGTYVFQGTVQEDGTGGTHVCTLTVTPGFGNEMQVSGGEVVEGNTATGQTTVVTVDDGTNVLASYVFASDTAANIRHGFPVAAIPAANTNNGISGGPFPLIVAGSMRLVLKVTTTAVSVTQTFAVVCRIRGMAKPTATLADTVGTPTLTTNTDKVF